MKQHIILFLMFTLCYTSCNRKANVSDVGLPKSEEKSLVALGQLWGFLKYHHPAVANGNYDWDMELIKRIPLVCEAKNDSVWKKLLDNWLDSLPPVPENPNKKLPNLEIKLKPDYGELFNPEYFYPKTIDKIRFILDNAVVTTNRYVKVDEKQQGQLFITNEPFYNELLYPELSYRLLALFRYWNIINYFFPYRELCDQKWSTVLTEMLPEFVYAKNREEYIFACLKLVTKIDDSHGTLSPNLNIGLLSVPFEVQFIENQLVVTRFTGNDSYVKEKIKIGDVITSINGESIDAIVKKMLPYTPASNYPVKLRGISSSMFLSGNSTIVNIVVQRDEKTFHFKIRRYDRRLLNATDYGNPQPDKEGYRILDNNIGYVLPPSCKVEEREQGVKKVLDGTKGVIIDMRCYPSNDYIIPSFKAHLKLRQEYNMMISKPNVSYPGYFFMHKLDSISQETKNLHIPKVVIIVNEYTQSAAEDYVMEFQIIPGSVVIGSTTAGADGRVVNFDLPGNIYTRMTGWGVYYPDGSNLQRAGAKIDEVVKPTIAGIKAGRDELLERAIEIINESNH